MSNVATNLLRAQFEQSKAVLEGTVEGITSEVAHMDPGGKTGTIAANVAHIITSMDGFLIGQSAGKAPLMMSSHADSHGISELPPQPGQDSSEWFKTVQVDLGAIHQYGLAVFEAVDEHLATLSDSDLEQVVEMGNFGEKERSWPFTIILLNNSWHTGEIAAIKGMQGLKGYAF